MSDQLDQGTVSDNPETQAADEQASTPTYLTEEQAQQLLEKMFTDRQATIENNLMQRQVNLYDKASGKLRKRLSELENTVQAMRGSGMVINDSDLNNLRNKIISDSFLEDAQEKPAAQQQPQQQLPQQDAAQEAKRMQAMVTSFGQSILSSLGVQFEDNAPELEMINAGGTAEDYLSSMTKAAHAWLQRNAEQPNPEARIPGVVSGSAPDNGWEKQYQKELAIALKDAHNSKNLVLQVRRKYRNLGYPV